MLTTCGSQEIQRGRSEYELGPARFRVAISCLYFFESERQFLSESGNLSFGIFQFDILGPHLRQCILQSKYLLAKPLFFPQPGTFNEL